MQHSCDQALKAFMMRTWYCVIYTSDGRGVIRFTSEQINLNFKLYTFPWNWCVYWYFNSMLACREVNYVRKSFSWLFVDFCHLFLFFLCVLLFVCLFLWRIDVKKIPSLYSYQESNQVLHQQRAVHSQLNVVGNHIFKVYIFLLQW